MQFGFAGAIVCLHKQAARAAVWDDALEARFQTAAGVEDYDGADFVAHAVAAGGVALGGFYGYGVEAGGWEVAHCSVGLVSIALNSSWEVGLFLPFD